MHDATILVVEDHDILREGLQILLETEGYKVISAIDGTQALAVMDELNPDLILSDISMPEMDGFAFYNQVRSRPQWITIPFVFLTAHGERDDVIESKRLGAEDYLIKPVDRQELVTTIRSRLDRSQQLMFGQLQQSYEASLIMLANAIELRDRYTRGHVERVMGYAVMIARKLDWPANQIQPLRYGAILHDIGKIYISERILIKTGPLNKDEWVEMKRHPGIGAELIENIPYLTSAIPVVRYHHERWDGKGYPEGLVGDDIPQAARVVSVADSFDAMTTHRAYKDAMTKEMAFVEIQAGSGTSYDPVAVEAFLAAWAEEVKP